MKKIKDFIENEKIDQLFMVNTFTKGLTVKGSNYLNLVLQDSSGLIDAKKWEVVDGDELVFQQGNIVRVEGEVLFYKGSAQIKIAKGEIAPKEEIDVTQFVANAPIERSILQKELFEFLEEIKNIEMKLIVEEIMKENFLSFSVYPAASKNHHEYASGLLHHTVSMLKMAKSFCELYPSLDKDLLYSGVILHDVGKTIELSGPILPKYTTEGRLVGHISIAQAQIKLIANKLAISGEIPILLQHMVLSHHGKLEFGSPVLPLLKEAEVLSYIDNIDARINSIDKALQDINEGEFTPRIFSLEDRTFYKPIKRNKE